MNHAERPQHVYDIYGPVLGRCLPVNEITHSETMSDPPGHLITLRAI